MQRATKDCYLIKEEFNRGLVKQTVYDNQIEYWIYEDTTSGILNDKGQYIVGGAKVKSAQRRLKCIVLCLNTPAHIVGENNLVKVIKGCKVDDVDTADLTAYLEKTGRTA
jgi:hypothetical protein